MTAVPPNSHHGNDQFRNVMHVRNIYTTDEENEDVSPSDSSSSSGSRDKDKESEIGAGSSHSVEVNPGTTDDDDDPSWPSISSSPSCASSSDSSGLRDKESQISSSFSSGLEVHPDTTDEDISWPSIPSSAAPSSSSASSSGSVIKPRWKWNERGKTGDFEIEKGWKEVPSEWLSEVYPKRTPYLPQIGDEVIYYRQGHESYVKFVELYKLYEMSEEFKRTLPYVVHPELRAAVPCRVGSMDFEIRPPRLVILKLNVMDWASSKLTGTSLLVQYHKMANIVDFLILRQIHDEYVRKYWNPGDRFRCLIDTQWWFGRVDRFQPNDERFPQSKFLCHWVTWDKTGEREKLSPWDMDVVTTNAFVQSNDSNGVVVATEEEIRNRLYKPTEADWPPDGNQKAQCEKLYRILRDHIGFAIFHPFREPVDINRHPKYAMVIEYPMDLRTIMARLHSRFYRRREALKFDLMYIASNARKYNKPDSFNVTHAEYVRERLLQLFGMWSDLKNDTKRSDMEMMKKSKSVNRNLPSDCKTIQPSSSTAKIPSSSSKITSQQPTCWRNSLRGQRRSQKSGKVDDRPSSWKEACRDLLEKIWKCPDSLKLRAPLNPKEYPGYLEGIDSPLDLQGVREHLLKEHYTSPLDFHENMTLIFDNFLHYHSDKRSQVMNSFYSNVTFVLRK